MRDPGWGRTASEATIRRGRQPNLPRPLRRAQDRLFDKLTASAQRVILKRRWEPARSS